MRSNSKLRATFCGKCRADLLAVTRLDASSRRISFICSDGPGDSRTDFDDSSRRRTEIAAKLATPYKTDHQDNDQGQPCEKATP